MISWQSPTTRVQAPVSVDVPAGEAQPPGVAKQCATTKPELAKSSGGAGPYVSRANGRNSAGITGAAMPPGEARPPMFVKYSVTSKTAESSDEAEPGRAKPSRKGTSRGCDAGPA